MKVPQFMPFVAMEEYESIKRCFETNWITEGPLSSEFNKKILKIINAKYGVFAPNGTLALILAMKALGIKPGDEVIVPNLTFFASASSVEFLGAKPVFVDVNKDSQLNVADCKRVLSSKTKAIMPVHLFGLVPDMSALKKFATEHNLLIIEDAAQAFGIKSAGQSCGTFGDIAAFSFFADKSLTTAEGGFVATNDKEIYDKLLFLRNQGRRDRGSFIHPEMGYNFRITDIQSAIGLAQLKKFDRVIKNKVLIHSKYTTLLNNSEHVEILQPSSDINPFIPFRVILKTKSNEAEQLMTYLQECDVEPRGFFYPLHKQPAFDFLKDDERYDDIHFPISNHIYKNYICLPSFVSINDEQIEYVTKTINTYYQKGGNKK